MGKQVHMYDTQQEASFTPEQATERLLLRAGHKGELDVESCKRLLERGADINVQEDDGAKGTALMYAVTHGDAALVAFLLLQGADVHIRSKSGFTALAMSVLSSYNSGIVTTLLDAGADVNERYSDDQPLIAYAAERNLQDMVLFLAGRGADIESSFGPDKTTLQEFVKKKGLPRMEEVVSGIARIRTRKKFEAAAAKGTIRKRPILRVRRDVKAPG
ncbi:MAG: ankyrin repeat domain-containing protein [Alphaproteobacteria bacterium]|nr:ankyrin repeat domain-containing protein [Alphaproteobacteria bacterium]